MVGTGNLCNILLIGEILSSLVHHVPKLAGVNEQHRAATVMPVAGILVAGQEPEVGRNLGGVEELSKQGDHAIYHVTLAGLSR